MMKHFKFSMAGRQLKHLWQGGMVILGSAAIAAGFTLLTPSSAKAQAAYGSYIGAGIGFGVTEGQSVLLPNGEEDSLEPRRTSAVVAFRYKFLKLPVSVRTQALIGDGVAVVPTVSYDIPLNWRTDVYVGAGASIPINGDEKTTPVGNQTAFAIQPGIDYALPNSDLVLFGNAIIAFNGYRIGGGAAVSLQGGVGLRF